MPRALATCSLLLMLTCPALAAAQEAPAQPAGPPVQGGNTAPPPPPPPPPAAIGGLGGLMGSLRAERLGDRTLESVIGEASAFPLGSKDNPVRADMPAGQRAYLDRLRCSNGRKPSYVRTGNYGVGVFGTIIDGYKVVCPGDGEPRDSMIFIDMYFPGYSEPAPVPGFTIKPLEGDI